MGKRIWIGCVALVGAWSALTGCEQSGNTSTATTNAGLEPGQAEEDCYAAYETCFAETGDELACKETFRACVGNVDEDGRPHHHGQPPADDPAFRCHETFRGCVETSDDPEACRVALDECLRAIAPPPGEGCPDRPDRPEGDVPPGPHPGHPNEEALRACHEAFRACLDAGTDPATCEADLRACAEEARPEPPDGSEPTDPNAPPPDHAARCQHHFDECIAAGEPAEMCQQRLDGCLAWTPDGDGDRPDGDRPEDGDRPHHPGPGEYPGGACHAGLDACLRFASDEAQVAACNSGFDACREAAPQPTGTY